MMGKASLCFSLEQCYLFDYVAMLIIFRGSTNVSGNSERQDEGTRNKIFLETVE